MIVREPIAAGRLYPALPDRCQAELAVLLAEGWSIDAQSRRAYGGIVPHGAWSDCGAVAARVFRACATASSPSVIVLLGGSGATGISRPALFTSGRWETPVGSLQVDDRLAERLMGHTNLIVEDVYAHENESSIEIQTPVIRHLLPGVKILPILVPDSDLAHEVGEAVARTLDVYDYNAMVVGISNLSRQGSGFDVNPVGDAGERFDGAECRNDQRMIDLISGLRSRDVVAEAAVHRNADNPGAVAAAIRAAVARGATEAMLLTQTNSAEAALSTGCQVPAEPVGYAGFVFR